MSYDKSLPLIMQAIDMCLNNVRKLKQHEKPLKCYTRVVEADGYTRHITEQEPAQVQQRIVELCYKDYLPDIIIAKKMVTWATRARMEHSDMLAYRTEITRFTDRLYIHLFVYY
jgi:hypothetical protein